MRIDTLIMLAIFYFSILVSIYWLLLIFGCKGVKCSNKAKKAKISVIIPAYNEEKNIAKTIDALKNQTYNKIGEIEIIVVDDGSKDKTAEIAKEKGAKVIKGEHKGKSFAVNKGLDFATGDYVLILDADTILDKKAIEEAMKCIDNKDAVVGMAIAVGDNLIAKLQDFEYRIGNYTREVLAYYNLLNMVPGAFSIIRKDVFDKIGKFSTETLTEDFEFGMRMLINNYKIGFSKNAYAYTIVPNNVKAWVKQRLRWFRGRLENIWKYKSRILKFDDFSFYLLVEYFSYITFILILIATIISLFKFLENIIREILAILRSKIAIIDFSFSVSEFIRRMNPLLYNPMPFIIFTFILVLFFVFITRAKEKHNIKIEKSNFLIYFIFYTQALTWTWIKSIIDEIRGADKKW